MRMFWDPYSAAAVLVMPMTACCLMGLVFKLFNFFL